MKCLANLLKTQECSIQEQNCCEKKADAAELTIASNHTHKKGVRTKMS